MNSGNDLRRCLSRWATGVAVITTLDDANEPRGLTANSFSSVSLDPPLILWSVARTAQSFAAFASAREFAVNVLADEQAPLARRFGKSGGSKFDDLQCASTAAGTPLLVDTAATFVCVPHASYDGGDHLIILGRVVSATVNPNAPLLFAEGKLRLVGAPAERPSLLGNDAALVIVGDELLSGRVTDSNGPGIARGLQGAGVDLKEIRIVGDDRASIASVVRSLRLSHAWVFVVGGLGPTHDDCTAAAVGDAFGLPLVPHPEAIRLLESHHAPSDIPPGRLPAANLPAGSIVLPDLISGTAGFKINNVIALPGVPEIASSLVETALSLLPSGVAFAETAIKAPVLEAEIAADVRETQGRHPSVKIGCYPYFGGTSAGVNVVLRSADAEALGACEAELRKILHRRVAR